MILSQAFLDYYRGLEAKFNKCEWRAKVVFEEDQLHHPPWTWDWDNYHGENKNMIGFYYPEDFENIRMQRELEAKWMEDHSK